MVSISMALVIGFLLGLRHALDPDHLIAVSNIVASGKSVIRATKVGLFWGLGHGIVVFIIGVLWIVLNIHIPDILSQRFEMLVGIILIFLGFLTFWGYRRDKVHMHTHTHDGNTHTHFHTHAKKENHLNHHDKKKFWDKGWVPFIVGMCHGTAGSAAILLLTLSTVREQFAFWYLGLFSLGTIISMGCLSMIVGLLIKLVNKKSVSIQRYIWLGSGLVSVLFGVWWIVSV